MDVLRMKVLLERYRQLKIRIENSRHRICRIKASSFEQYIEEKTYHSPLGERRLQGGKPSHPTETLGIYGRVLFERFCYGEAAGKACSMWAAAVDEQGRILWDYDSCSYTGKSEAPVQITGAGRGGLVLDGKPVHGGKVPALQRRIYNRGQIQPIPGFRSMF